MLYSSVPSAWGYLLDLVYYRDLLKLSISYMCSCLCGGVCVWVCVGLGVFFLFFIRVFMGQKSWQTPS